MIAGNLPIAPLRLALRAATLEQAWDVFAPDPVHAEVELEATVLFADGTEEIWTPPRAPAALAVLTYHWELWSRAVVTGYRPVAQATAQWIATQHARAGKAAVRVTLRRRWYEVPPPASGRPPLWRESDFFVHSVAS
jgi:hypothetical protein